SVSGVSLPHFSRSRVARSSKFVLGLVQVRFGHIEFMLAREPIEDRHLHSEKCAQSIIAAAEVVRMFDADLQLGFGNVDVQRDLWIILGTDLADLIFL